METTYNIFIRCFEFISLRMEHNNFCWTVFHSKSMSETGQIESQGTGQKLKFLSTTRPQDNFVSQVQVIKLSNP
jgi:hypothetical protein